MKVILEDGEKEREDAGHRQNYCIRGMGMSMLSASNTRTYTLYSIIKEYVQPDSIIYNEKYLKYDLFHSLLYCHSRLKAMRCLLVTTLAIIIFFSLFINRFCNLHILNTT